MLFITAVWNRLVYGPCQSPGAVPPREGSYAVEDAPEVGAGAGSSGSAAAAALAQNYLGYKTTDLTNRFAIYWYQKGEEALSSKEKYNAIAMLFNAATVLMGYAIYQAVFGNPYTAFVWGAIAWFGRNEAEIAFNALSNGPQVNSAWFGSHVAWKGLIR